MRNQPWHPELHSDAVDSESLIDPPSGFRFAVLAMGFVAAAVVVLGRIGWVQGKLPERYLSALNATTVDYEEIPARDGRILTESSEVLASDVDQFSIEVHYRWLQEPVNSEWLQRQIRARLSRSERRDQQLVAAEEERLLTQRTQLWMSLAQVANISSEQLSETRQQIQRKVQRIADSVNQRRNQQRADNEVHDEESLLLRWAASIRAEVTTSPGRQSTERIVVREEESYHEVVADVSLDIAAQIREQPHRFPGVRVSIGHRRIYPHPALAAHVVGARSEQQQNDSQAPDLPSAQSAGPPRVGRFGIEYTYDHQLRSVPGLRRVVRNRRMEIVSEQIERQPIIGRDIVLTLDSKLQTAAEELLSEALMDAPRQRLEVRDEAEDVPQPVPSGGSIVVMEVATGRLFVVASAPTFSLDLFTRGTSEQWEAANSDQRRPFLARATAMAIPPGSVIKPLTAVAAMQSGAIDPDAAFHCQGYLSNPDEHRCLIFRLHGTGHGEITLTQAMAQSCNVYFFSAARKTGFGPLRGLFENFGLGQRTGVDLPFEKNGTLPGNGTSNAARSQAFEREVLGLAIGQSRLTVTPLQIARVMAAIANGGWLVTPHVVSADGMSRKVNDIDDHPRSVTRRRISSLHTDTLMRVREAMTAVVQQPLGTGYRTIRNDAVAVAGKTGTAETGGGRPDHAWFAGFVPAEQPQFAVVVVLEHGGSGSRAAGPVAREMILELHRNGHLN